MKLLNTSAVREVAHQAVSQRLNLKQSQTEFWSRFGISQACASRIECTSQVPAPVYILLRLYLSGRLQESDLAQSPHQSGRDQFLLNGSEHRHLSRADLELATDVLEMEVDR